MLDKGRILDGRLLLRPVKEEEKTASGLIYKAPIVKPKNFTGEVVLVGNPLLNSRTQVNVGDFVLMPPHAKVELEVNNETFFLVRQEDVLFIWRK
jgi:co-chaperonin GroES (HSP10)